MSRRSALLPAPRRTRLAVAVSALALAVTGGVVVQHGLVDDETEAAACPAGSSHLSVEYLRELTGTSDADAEREAEHEAENEAEDEAENEEGDGEAVGPC